MFLLGVGMVVKILNVLFFEDFHGNHQYRSVEHHLYPLRLHGHQQVCMFESLTQIGGHRDAALDGIRLIGDG